LTPDALESELLPWQGNGWRLVEAQHLVSTLKLVDDLDEQSLLEEVIDGTKPPVPEECRHLDYLLSTPFRYGSPYPAGSRFRRAGLTDGVYYCSQTVETAVAEMAFYRLLFFSESPKIGFPDLAASYTALCAAISTERSVDLTVPPLVSHSAIWMHPTDYDACQRFADTARALDADLIRYTSVRDPGRGANLAVLRCRAFKKPAPIARQSWRLAITAHGVSALCEAPRRRISFPAELFAADPRLVE